MVRQSEKGDSFFTLQSPAGTSRWPNPTESGNCAGQRRAENGLGGGGQIRNNQHNPYTSLETGLKVGPEELYVPLDIYV